MNAHSMVGTSGHLQLDSQTEVFHSSPDCQHPGICCSCRDVQATALHSVSARRRVCVLHVCLTPCTFAARAEHVPDRRGRRRVDGDAAVEQRPGHRRGAGPHGARPRRRADHQRQPRPGASKQCGNDAGRSACRRKASPAVCGRRRIRVPGSQHIACWHSLHAGDVIRLTSYAHFAMHTQH